MSVKKAVKIAVDVGMAILFLLLMSYHLLPNAVHEWVGVAMFVLFIAHTLLNLKWYARLFSGRYNAVRILNTVVNLLLLVAMLCCIVSSLYVSMYVLDFIDLSAVRFGRMLHLCATVWAFILSSIHLGLHMQIFLSRLKAKPTANESVSAESSAESADSDSANSVNNSAKTVNKWVIIKWVLRAVALVLSAFGLYIFISRSMWQEMFVLTEFKWFDYDKSLAVYIIENVCLMALFAAAGHYIKQGLRNIRRR